MGNLRVLVIIFCCFYTIRKGMQKEIDSANEIGDCLRTSG